MTIGSTSNSVLGSGGVHPKLTSVLVNSLLALSPIVVPSANSQHANLTYLLHTNHIIVDTYRCVLCHRMTLQQA
jgi:hypothetical protein